MNRSNTSPRVLSAAQLRAALEEVGGSARPDYLSDIVARAGRTRQRPAWTLPERWLPVDIAVRQMGVPRMGVVPAAVVVMLALLVAAVAFVGSQSSRPAPLPATIGAWERVLIETPSGTGTVVSLAAGPRGLLAVVRATVGGPGQLFVSADGRSWSPVPADEHPPIPSGDAAVVGTARGFVMVGAGAWFSEDGFDWQRLGSSAGDSDLGEGTVLAVTVGGPGYVAVGSDNRAWYSTDGSDWSLAQVPPPPTQFFASRGFSEPAVVMRGVAVAGDKFVAWGLAQRHLEDSGLNSPVMWASDDGRTWVSVLEPVDGDSLTAAAGPGGFVAVEGDQGATVDEDQLAVRVSADGRTWETVAVLGPTWSEDAQRVPVQLSVESIAATGSGFVAAGGLGQVCAFSCEPGEVVIWTSEGGRSWSRLPSDERFARAAAFDIVAWGSVFVVGGDHDGQPAIWIGGAP